MTQFITGVAFMTVVGTAGGCAIYFFVGGTDWASFAPNMALITLAIAVVSNIAGARA